MKFRKKTVVVEAEQFWPDKPLPHRDRGPVVCFNGDFFYVITAKGFQVLLRPGDWIVLEPTGSCKAYPVRADIFEATHELCEGKGQP